MLVEVAGVVAPSNMRKCCKLLGLSRAIAICGPFDNVWQDRAQQPPAISTSALHVGIQQA